MMCWLKGKVELINNKLVRNISDGNAEFIRLKSLLYVFKLWCYMQPHGDYKVELINDVVHVFPLGGFNEEGIQEVREQVLLIAPKDRAWGLFEHPKDLAGLTPEALGELLKSYQYFSDFNCKVVALEVNATWQGVIEKGLKGNLDIPFSLSNDLDQLEVFIKQHLSCA